MHFSGKADFGRPGSAECAYRLTVERRLMVAKPGESWGNPRRKEVYWNQNSADEKSYANPSNGNRIESAPIPAGVTLAEQRGHIHSHPSQHHVIGDEDGSNLRQLLAKVGLKDGFCSTISTNSGDPTQEPIALIPQRSWRRIGVNVQLEKLPAGVFYENVTKRQEPIIFYLDSPRMPDPGYSTFLYFNDKTYVDYSVRKSTYGQVLKILMDEAPWGFLSYLKYVLARKAALKGFTCYTSNNLRFQDFRRG
jgi:ABC-type transport system substrate-binding protein